jgi:limonene-1,2-epoxide hydrolase
MNAIDTVLELVSACNARDLGRLLALFDERIIYHNMPMAPLRGVAGVRSVMQPFIDGSQRIEWTVHHIAQCPNGTVMVERTDRFLMQGRWLSVPVMGAFEITAGKITHWRDYYDQGVIHTQLRELPGNPFVQSSPQTSN